MRRGARKLKNNGENGALQHPPRLMSGLKTNWRVGGFLIETKFNIYINIYIRIYNVYLVNMFSYVLLDCSMPSRSGTKNKKGKIEVFFCFFCCRVPVVP